MKTDRGKIAIESDERVLSLGIMIPRAPGWRSDSKDSRGDAL